MSQQRIIVVHIFSTSYAGSTWLNLMLGAHPEAMSVGEVKVILRQGRAICTLHDESCPVWPQVDLSEGKNIYHELARVTGKRVFIVNNSRKYLSHQQDPDIESRFVHLIRDGRAVVASHLRKFKERTLYRACQIWQREVRRNMRLMRRYPSNITTQLNYETLQHDTAGELQRLCDFIGIAYDPIMMRYWEVDQHFLGGNRGTLYNMMASGGGDQSREQITQNATAGIDWDLSTYQQVNPAQFRDERWMREMTAGQLRLFDPFTLWLNRRLGYPSATRVNSTT